MNKEKEIEELAEILYSFGANKTPNNADYHMADYLINLGYGNVKQAVKEFAEKLKKVIAEKHFGWQLYIEIDNLIKQLYGEEGGVNDQATEKDD